MDPLTESQGPLGIPGPHFQKCSYSNIWGLSSHSYSFPEGKPSVLVSAPSRTSSGASLPSTWPPLCAARWSRLSWGQKVYTLHSPVWDGWIRRSNSEAKLYHILSVTNLKPRAPILLLWVIKLMVYLLFFWILYLSLSWFSTWEWWRRWCWLVP